MALISEKTRNTFWAITATLFCLQAFAQTDSELINGLSSHSEFNNELFIASLNTQILTSSVDEYLNNDSPKSIEIRVVAPKLSSRRMVRIWVQGMAINHRGELLATYADTMVEFTNAIKRTLLSGDQLRIETDGVGSLRTLLNGVEINSLQSEGFYDILIRGLVGSVPLSSDFKTNLVASGDIDQALLTRYRDTQPSALRTTAISDSVSAKQDKAEPKLASPKESTKEKAVKVAAAPKKPSPPKTAPVIAKPEIKAPPKLVKPKPAPEPEKVAKAQAELPKTQESEQKPKEEVAQLEKEPETADLTSEENTEDEVFTVDSILAEQSYTTSIIRETYKYVSYPQKSVDRNEKGSLRLQVVLDRSGSLVEVKPVEESPFSRLNKAAVKAVKKAAPFNSIPDQIKGELYVVSIPFRFELPD